MKHNAIRISKALCGVVVMLAMFMAGITSISVQAASNGIYLATATPHYRHPQTGVIEDSGGDGSAVLGQSMTESATYRKALVEVDPAGNTHITVRLQLMDNIKDPQFQVDGSPVSATLMQEDYTNNTADYRMKVNSENSVIRCSMYVIAMGRSVVFYITVSGLQSGSGDFITSVEVKAPVDNTPAAQAAPKKDNDTGNTPAQKSQDNKGAAQKTEAQTESGNNAPADSQTQTESTSEESTTESSTEETDTQDSSNGLQEFDASGEQVNETDADKESESDKKTNPAPFIIIGIVVVAAAGCGVWFYIKKKK